MTAPLSSSQREALRSASHWYAVLSGERVSPQQELKWQRWVDANQDNQWAWQQVENLRQQMQGMPGEVASKALRDSQITRRHVLKGLLLTVGVGAGWQLWRSEYAAGLGADYRTARGEIRHYPLDDGSLLTLDTASAANVSFTALERRIDLIEGTLAITTGKDAALRPLRVYTRQGQMTALGTAFSVQQQPDSTLLRVSQHAVAVRLNHDATQSLTVQQGQSLHFTADRFGALTRDVERTPAWINGWLSVSDRPLGEVIDQLARYRQGMLRCDADAAQLRVTGTFPLLNSDQALLALEQTLPVALHRITRYWVRVTRR
ncbi:ferric citrate uptake sigma factor regulator FecR [Pantoea phytobeneficialis]|uniref:Ferric citrate uptake sigma factor regulator FecR n=1 Tax=Pantoea phytobeneficialis TaxID=2052056 RepID=A0AAP9HAX3_9GAMM|nr:ferric citrate uptake sigma factor regulator FecR [Pantoea phytobeneficialis]MDO6407478.1 ferric citrate uptake sigma factor regulator FecR [Pantoea phytobeneficialis]QGR09474.1 iron dicitrate transport regulator FecR [Pantoea phytobeneficialis]